MICRIFTLLYLFAAPFLTLCGSGTITYVASILPMSSIIDTYISFHVLEHTAKIPEHFVIDSNRNN